MFNEAYSSLNQRKGIFTNSLDMKHNPATMKNGCKYDGYVSLLHKFIIDQEHVKTHIKTNKRMCNE